MITRESIQAQLDRLKLANRVVNNGPQPYSDFMPASLGHENKDMSSAYQHLDQINRREQKATLLTETMVQNTRDYQEMMRRKAELERARGLHRATQTSINQGIKDNSGMTFGNYTGSRNFGAKWGKDNTPEVSDLKRIQGNPMIVPVHWRGKTMMLSKQVAPIFVAFLDDLYKAGYRPLVLGGFSNRNIAGTNTLSNHARGLALDIDPTQNPVQHGGSNRNILPPNVASMAAKYGLSWGGSWHSYKDPMHFSVAYRGVQ